MENMIFRWNNGDLSKEEAIDYLKHLVNQNQKKFLKKLRQQELVFWIKLYKEIKINIYMNEKLIWNLFSPNKVGLTFNTN